MTAKRTISQLTVLAVVTACALAALGTLDWAVTARELGIQETQRVVGAGAGFCQTDPVTLAGWTCPAFRTFACANPCTNCGLHGTQSGCLTWAGQDPRRCWLCKDGTVVQIKECQDTKGLGCTEFGAPGASVCGWKHMSGCVWHAALGTCVCDVQNSTAM